MELRQESPNAGGMCSNRDGSGRLKPRGMAEHLELGLRPVSSALTERPSEKGPILSCASVAVIPGVLLRV